MIGQLCHKSHIDGGLDGVILVISPVVLKVALKSLSHLLGQRAASVEMGKQTQPLGEVLTIFIVSGNVLQVHENVDKLTHDVGEASHTYK